MRFPAASFSTHRPSWQSFYNIVARNDIAQYCALRPDTSTLVSFSYWKTTSHTGISLEPSSACIFLSNNKFKLTWLLINIVVTIYNNHSLQWTWSRYYARAYTYINSRIPYIIVPWFASSQRNTCSLISLSWAFMCSCLDPDCFMHGPSSWNSMTRGQFTSWANFVFALPRINFLFHFMKMNVHISHGRIIFSKCFRI